MAILLNPGPVNLSERVRRALLKPDLCHREPEFNELQQRIRGKLLRVYSLEDRIWSAVLLTGSGTAAVEAMLTSLVPAAGRLLILANGVYGERMERIAETYGIPHDTAKHDWGAPINLDLVKARLDTARDITHVAVVHHETTTGRLNDLAALAATAHGRGARLLVDGVSSFGGEEIRFDDWGIDACAGTANKCLHGVPGTSFVIARRSALGQAARRSHYLDLASYGRLQDAGEPPFTPSIQTCYALDEALDEFFEQGGWPARRDCYRRRMRIVREGLLRIGIRPLLEDDAGSCILSAFHLPEGMDYPRLHDLLKEHGYVIYAGQGGLQKRIFRVSIMGEISEGDLERLTRILAELKPVATKIQPL
jgi:2-aminoethylphosphonate-pyruvate transaminase